MIKTVSQTFFAKVVVAAVNFLLIIVTARWLGADARGEISLCILSVSLISLINDIIGGPSLSYLVPRVNKSMLVGVSYFWAVGVTFSGTFLLSTLDYFNTKYFFHVLFSSLFLSLNAVHMAMLIGLEKVKYYNILSLTLALCLLMVFLLCYFLFGVRGATAYLTAYAVACFLQFSAGFVMVSEYWSLKHFLPGSGLMTQIIKNGLFTQWASLTYLLSSRMLFYLMEKSSGSASLGVFSTALTITEATLLFSSSMALVASSRIVNTDDNEVSAELTVAMSRISLWVTLALGFFLAACPQGIYAMVFGPEFAQLKLLIISLFPAVLCQSFFTVISHYYSGRARFYVNALIGTLCLLFSLILCYIYNGKVTPGNASVIIVSTSFFAMICYLTVFYRKNTFKLSNILISAKDLSGLSDGLKKMIG